MKARAWLLGVLMFAVLPACDYVEHSMQRPPEITFLDAAAPDLALVEYRLPLGAPELNALEPDHLASYTQGQIDQLYARLTAGPIPDGVFDGAIFIPKQSDPKLQPSPLGNVVWRRKVFDRQERLARSPVEQKLVLPAKLYCGQSLLDARRESIVIDYAFTDELPGYRVGLDDSASRSGLQIRDEIRMVRPGFYLGRAYSGRTFLLNFSLYNANVLVEQNVGEDCWPGTQQRARL